MLKGVLSTLDSVYAVENRSCLRTIKYKVTRHVIKGEAHDVS